jgi:hypothetical protein
MGKYKISVDKHFEIVTKYLSGLSTSELAIEYSVNSETIRNILKKSNTKRRPSNNIRPEFKVIKICNCCKKELPNNIIYFGIKGFNCKYKNGEQKLMGICRKCSYQKTVIYTRDRRKSDLEFKLRGDISSRTRSAIKRSGIKKTSKTIILLGCSIKELKFHLEKQFQEDMSWDNYGLWHIDHIKPCSSFNLLDPEEQKKCFHYSNLQPLWAKDNLSKSSYYQGVRYYNFNKNPTNPE